MSAVLLGLVFISPPFLKKWLLKWFGGAKFGHQAQIGWFSSVVGNHVEMGDYSVVRPFTLIYVDGDVRLKAYSEISSFCMVYGSSTLEVGEGSYIGPHSLINVDELVSIGNASALGARTMIFTHGSFFPYTQGYWVKLAGVTLGDKVWCAAGVFIHPGVEIGENSFVNSGAVVAQSIPAGSIAEGNPAKVIYPMERVQRKMTPRHVDLALEKVLDGFVEIGLRRELGLDLIEREKGKVEFIYRGTRYMIQIIPSSGDVTPDEALTQGGKFIYLVNCAGWKPVKPSLVFDIENMVTTFSKDRIHTALRLFALRYYGMRFKDAGLVK